MAAKPMSDNKRQFALVYGWAMAVMGAVFLVAAYELSSWGVVLTAGGVLLMSFAVLRGRRRDSRQKRVSNT